MESIVESFARLIGKQRELLSLAGEAEDGVDVPQLPWALSPSLI
jgi:hypothetical protein